VKLAGGDSPFAVDRTAKLYIGGKQARPDGAYSRAILGTNGDFLADVGEGNRKDIRNAVEAAHKASGWAKATAHNRAQVLYYIAENLAVSGPPRAEQLAKVSVNQLALEENDEPFRAQGEVYRRPFDRGGCDRGRGAAPGYAALAA